MNHERFKAYCRLMDAYDIKPILAVIPDNKDKQIYFGDYDDDFFKEIKSLQDKGYTIALHGYNHLYIGSNPGILGLNRKSEFAGEQYSTQEKKIRYGKNILASNGIEVEMFIAPAHSFDRNTLRALTENGINFISDGFFMFLKEYEGIVFVPQQLWRFRNIRLPGVYTFCLHLDLMDAIKFENFLRDSEIFLKKNQKRFITFDTLKTMSFNRLHKKLLNIIFENFYKYIYRIKKVS